MCDGDIDTILSYLSSKINKIVCDREFVGCVKEDLDVILENSKNSCVVFPKLKPVFLKLLRYQALIFDLNVSQIGSGQNQITIVCKKAILKEHPECLAKPSPKTMNEKLSLVKVKKTRANRPTQSYYVPPAQRSKKKSENVKAKKKAQNALEVENVSQRASLSVSESSDDREPIFLEEEKIYIKEEVPTDSSITSKVKDDVLGAEIYIKEEVPTDSSITSEVKDDVLGTEIDVDSDCDSVTVSGLTIKDSQRTEDNIITITHEPDRKLEEISSDVPSLQLKEEGDVSCEPTPVCDCEKNCNEPSLNDESDSSCIIEPPLTYNDSTSINEEDSSTIKNNINKSEVKSSTDESDLYISSTTMENKKSVDNEAEIEEEMQKAIQNISRKRRTIIKHICNEDISKEIIELPKASVEEDLNDEGDSLSNWEDMFDDSGDLKAKYFKEIVKHIGCDVKVVKASHDYSAYENTKYQDLEHVIELYDFPSSFRTQDLVQLYSSASKDPMYIKWCDNTHALLVLSTPSKAQRALKIEHDIIKSRPLSEGSSVAIATACSTDLKPAMTRPATNMQTARRLINTHLGTRSALSKEVQEQERQALKVAREQRRQERQNEKDAWEGRLRSAKSQCSS